VVDTAERRGGEIPEAPLGGRGGLGEKRETKDGKTVKIGPNPCYRREGSDPAPGREAKMQGVVFPAGGGTENGGGSKRGRDER